MAELNRPAERSVCSIDGRFRTAAPFYLRGRPAYAPLLIRRVALTAGLKPSDRIMDLGCGPAQLAVAFAPFVKEAVAVDPEPAMLKMASEYAAALNVSIQLIQGSSDELTSALGRFHVIVIGRAFHWMVRDKTLEALDRLVESEGVVALFRTRHPELPENAWHEAYNTLLREYAVDDERRAQRKSPDWVPDEAILLHSPFSQVERISIVEPRKTRVETFLDRAFSQSSTSPSRIGSRADELAQRMRALMISYAVDGHVSEIVESEAVIGRRPRLIANEQMLDGN